MDDDDDNTDNGGSIPFSVSFVELMNLYDRLLIMINSHGDVASSLLSQLRLVCSLLRQCLNLTLDQRNSIECTCRRAYLLELLLSNDDIATDDIASSSFWVPVEIVAASSSATPESSREIFEWKYVHPVVSISQQELMAEEALLLQMAHTPIPAEGASNPINETTSGTLRFHSEVLQQQMRELWDEATCQQKIKELRSGGHSMT